MKVLTLCIVCITLLVPPPAAEAKSCQSATHCRDDECCMSKSSLVGACRAMGCKGCACVPNNSKSHLGDMYLMSCPCTDGLACVAEKVIENPDDDTYDYINATCQDPERLNTLNQTLIKRTGLLPAFLKKLIKWT